MTDTEILLFEFDVEPPHEGETYEIQHSPNGVSGWETIGFTNDQFFEGVNVPIRSTHWLRVRMFDDGVWSLFSEPAEVTTNYAYDVRESLAGADDWTVIAESVEGFAHDVTEREPNTAYDVSMRARDAFSESDWSDSVEVTTLSDTATLAWLAPPADSTISGMVDLVTETDDERVVTVEYLIDGVPIGSTGPDE